MNFNNYVGIDISKAFFDVAIQSGEGYRYYKFSNDLKGFKGLQKLLPENSQAVMEASGPYYLKLACYLHELGILVSVINPLVIRRFCQMRLTRAKTDKKDAKMIAEYGKAERPSLWKPEEGYVLQLKQMQAAMDLLNKSKTSFIRQAEAFDANEETSKEAARAIATARQAIEKQLVSLEQKMQALIKQHHGEMYQQLQSIPGLGKKSALLLIVLSGGFAEQQTTKLLYRLMPPDL
ncbi:MAG: Transposase family protein [Sphingobacteriaceae bacterium]|jgi:transposase|nr:Transposase family protein [Sphingobacteriaceae bacterium]